MYRLDLLFFRCRKLYWLKYRIQLPLYTWETFNTPFFDFFASCVVKKISQQVSKRFFEAFFINENRSSFIVYHLVKFVAMVWITLIFEPVTM